MSDRLGWVIAWGVGPVALLVSYGLALAGEPQAVWLWHSVLGVL